MVRQSALARKAFATLITLILDFHLTSFCLTHVVLFLVLSNLGHCQELFAAQGTEQLGLSGGVHPLRGFLWSLVMFDLTHVLVLFMLVPLKFSLEGQITTFENLVIVAPMVVKLSSCLIMLLTQITVPNIW